MGKDWRSCSRTDRRWCKINAGVLTSLIQSVPRTSAENWTGSEARADARGGGRSKAPRAGTSTEQ